MDIDVDRFSERCENFGKRATFYSDRYTDFWSSKGGVSLECLDLITGKLETETIYEHGRILWDTGASKVGVSPGVHASFMRAFTKISPSQGVNHACLPSDATLIVNSTTGDSLRIPVRESLSPYLPGIGCLSQLSNRFETHMNIILGSPVLKSLYTVFRNGSSGKLGTIEVCAAKNRKTTVTHGPIPMVKA